MRTGRRAGFDRPVEITLSTPSVAQLDEVVAVLGRWQDDVTAFQLHPGDLGWFWRYGAEATAAAVRTWSRDGEVLAIGLLDGAEVLRMTVAPELWREEELARQVLADVSDPTRGVLQAGVVSIEAPNGCRVQGLLSDVGWNDGEAWTPLTRDLTEPVVAPELRIELVGPQQASAYAAVVASAFGTQPREERWHAMATGPAYADACSLIAYDDQGAAAAVATVWSAGPGRPGVIEPMGVHADHRGHGYGRMICVAAAAELQRMGASSATVCTSSERTAAVATYGSAGFRSLPERLDRTRRSEDPDPR